MKQRFTNSFASAFFSERPIRQRISIISLVYLACFCVIILRGFLLHLKEDNKLTNLAKNQYQKKILEIPSRGNIYDTKGENLAVDIQVDSLYVDPVIVKDLPVLATKLSGILSIPSSELDEILKKPGRYVRIKRWLSEEESQKIRSLQASENALILTKESKRFYPHKELVSTVIGAVGYDSQALGGLESYYDSYLKQKSETIVVDRDGRGQSYSPNNTDKNKTGPYHLKLTLDKTIQFFTKRELERAVLKASAKSGIAVVIDNRTGEVLAMASYPDFDPNNFRKSDLQHWRNRIITDPFEPGSIFKAIPATAALESGKFSTHDKIDCEGGDLKIGSHTIHDHGHYGALTLAEIIKVSSNIGVYKIAQALGKEEFAEVLSSFGFGKKTGIDLPGESAGILSPPSRWSILQQGTIAFGQGISVTPLQIAMAYAAIANQGNLMKPYIVKEIIDTDGNIIQENKPQIVRRIMSAKTAHEVTQMLKLVVGTGGTGEAAEVAEYGVAGKTGTAQKVNEGRGRFGYAEGKYVASFVGFAPVENPKITVLVSINEPKGNHFGGVVAAPAFAEIVRQVLPYLQVPPKNHLSPVLLTRANEAPTLTANSENKDLKLLKKADKQKPQTTELTLVKKRPLTLADSVAAAEALEVKPGYFKVPDLKGKTMRQILSQWDQDNLPLLIEGSGVCVEQTPVFGKLVPKGTPLKLSFRLD